MIKPGPAFTRPRTPAAKCLHLVRTNKIVTRSELVEATGLSQPTITRATAALLNAGLLVERNDLTQTKGRGRPTVPLEAAETDWMFAGIAVGTHTTFIGLYDDQGRTIRDGDFDTPVAKLSEDDFIEHIIAGVNRLAAGVDKTLVSVGLTASGTVDDNGLFHAPNLGWDGVDIAERLRYQFSVPIVTTSVTPAILGSETQSADLAENDPVMVLFADDSIGAALSAYDGVQQLTPLPEVDGEPAEDVLATAKILRRLAAVGVHVDTLAAAAKAAKTNSAARDILDNRARQLGSITAQLAAKFQPATVVVAGSAFYDDPVAPGLFAGEVRSHYTADNPAPHLRLIPSHGEIVKAIARAVALDPLLRLPLTLVSR